eukprot:CAMPEP_0178905360 /NCGR_PEP_ID=MMETSP0786-20121207/6234_1 /TAXON_ID=186022 /ORGANISM="Thalassionema frauenfeldii, Strain CCMP 1798" /LENGTH=191 /DNA_ID=CAMNT_0020576963 /DNA_START=171 /DNA_END=742 /DNA_ORIENTATION=+
MTTSKASVIGPSLCSDGITEGYSEATVLRNDLQDKSGYFTLCPNSTLDLKDGPLLIRKSVTLRCGDQKDLTGECTLEGGERQLIINGEIAVIQVNDIKFQNATQASVSVIAQSSFVNFRRCSWIDNTGFSVVYLGNALPDYPALTASPSLSLEPSAYPSIMPTEPSQSLSSSYPSTPLSELSDGSVSMHPS